MWECKWAAARNLGNSAARTLIKRFPATLASPSSLNILIPDGTTKATATLKLLGSVESSLVLSTKLTAEGPPRLFSRKFVKPRLNCSCSVHSSIPSLPLDMVHLLPRPRGFGPSSPVMATLRLVPLISTLLNPYPPSLPRFSNPRRITPFITLSNHANPSSQSKASSPTPSKSFQTFQDSGLSKLQGGEQLESNSVLGSFVSDHARELALGSLVFALVCLPDEHALALGPGGPLMEEFWDNVRRYGFYFFTVVSGGLYSLAKPLLDLMKDPSTQILVAVVVIGTFYLMYLTVSTMLGLNDFVYQYAQ